MVAGTVPSPDQRRQALHEVLESQAFARSEQLKSFLRYVCELAIAGREEEIKEYSIGVEALGRPATYSPADDSSVRRRAFELRQKLEDVYGSELAASPVCIEIPKGTYIPQFRFRGEGPAPDSTLRKMRWPLAVALAFVAGLALGVLALRVLRSPAPVRTPHLLIQEAWGPLATPQGNVLLCVATNFHMVVRSGGFNPESGLPSFPAPREIYPLYQKSNPYSEGAPLTMRPALNVASLGVAAGVAAAASTLSGYGSEYQILPERSVPLAGFRNRNVILFGDPLNSFAAAQLLSRAILTIAHDPDSNRLVIRDRRKPASAPPAFSRREARPASPAEVFGLLTVLPSDSAPGQLRRTLIISGVSQVGAQGAMEFFAAPDHLADLKARFRRDGIAGFPRSYQVVVRCTADDSLPLSCAYAAHFVINP